MNQLFRLRQCIKHYHCLWIAITCLMHRRALSENASYSYPTAGNGHSGTVVASEDHQLMDDPFFGEAADKFAGNSFGKLPLSLIPIGSPMPCLDDLLEDDDLMPYLCA
ncbi:unnamed protein product [Urochloa humidicola]